MTRRACLLFDLDDTLVHYDHGVRVRALAQRLHVAPERIEAELFASGLERDADLGRYDAQQQADELARRLGVPVALADCIAARSASMTPDPDTIELAQCAGRRPQLAILTNNGLLIRDNLSALCPPLAPLFADRVFCSAEVGFGKPEPAVYLHCARRLGVQPGAIRFIDDKRANTDAARAAGLRAHHHTNADALRAALQAHDLLRDSTETRTDAA